MLQRGIQFVQCHPVACFTALTASVCTYMEVEAAWSTYAMLTASQHNISRVVESTSSELREVLRVTDVKFNSAMRQRDELTRRLQLQNVDQTKAVARLQAALRMCVRDPKQFSNPVQGGSGPATAIAGASSTIDEADVSSDD